MDEMGFAGGRKHLDLEFPWSGVELPASSQPVGSNPGLTASSTAIHLLRTQILVETLQRPCSANWRRT